VQVRETPMLGRSAYKSLHLAKQQKKEEKKIAHLDGNRGILQVPLHALMQQPLYLSLHDTQLDTKRTNQNKQVQQTVPRICRKKQPNPQLRAPRSSKSNVDNTKQNI
jgi:hypothetical protein